MSVSALSVTDSDFRTINTIRELNIEKKKKINTLPVRVDKKTIADKLSISYPGVSSSISKLMGENSSRPVLLKEIDDDEAASTSYEINGDAAYFLGISIGSMHLKLKVLDFAFNEVDIIKKGCVESDCENTPYDSLDSLKRNINSWILACIKEINIAAVCVAFPGFIDPVKNIVLSTPNLLYINYLQVNSLFYSDTLNELNAHNISVFIQHSAKTALIAEKVFNSNVSIFNDPNIACFYMGTGVAVGLLLNNTLYNGESNFAGEFGHTKLFGSYEQAVTDNKHNIKKYGKCGCGQYGCFEQIIRNDVFGCDDAYSFGMRYMKEELNDFFSDTKFAYYLGLAISNLMNVYCFNKIIFAGILHNVFDKISDNLETYTSIYCNPTIKPLLSLYNSECGTYSTATGAAIYAYYKYFGREVFWG